MAVEGIVLTLERIQNLYKDFQKLDRDNDGFISLKSLKEDLYQKVQNEKSEENFAKMLNGVQKFIKLNESFEAVKSANKNTSDVMRFIEESMKSRKESRLSFEQLNEILDQFFIESSDKHGFVPLTDAKTFINFKGILQVAVNCARITFQEIDKDKNGTITRKEMQEFFKKEIPFDVSSGDDDSDIEDKNNLISKKAAKLLIAECDQDGDGELSFKEFFDGLELLEHNSN